jgi:hypothetical protein
VVMLCKQRGEVGVDCERVSYAMGWKVSEAKPST